MGTPVAAAASEKGLFYRIEAANSGVAAGERVRVEIRTPATAGCAWS